MVVVSSAGYIDIVTTLLVVLPVSRTARGWPNHVPLTGVAEMEGCFVITEQPRTVSRERLEAPVGQVDEACLVEVKQWLADFLDL